MLNIFEQTVQTTIIIGLGVASVFLTALVFRSVIRRRS
jgi:hypothetical protein